MEQLNPQPSLRATGSNPMSTEWSGKSSFQVARRKRHFDEKITFRTSTTDLSVCLKMCQQQLSPQQRIGNNILIRSSCRRRTLRKYNIPKMSTTIYSQTYRSRAQFHVGARDGSPDTTAAPGTRSRSPGARWHVPRIELGRLRVVSALMEQWEPAWMSYAHC